jgi:hypothetical protein
VRRSTFRSILVATILATALPAAAQDQSQDMPPHDHAAMMAMSSLFRPRESSGTSWVPDETPMYGVSKRWHGWELMLHGQVFGQFLYEPGYTHRTGGFSTTQTSSVNWGMAMARRELGSGRLGVQTMLSAEPWTVKNCGFINRLASGEICEGDSIHDRQHPHDLVMELSADYDRPLGGVYRLQIYAGAAGEPALGPTAFPHRLSAALNPVAPISHHWLDSSHVTFGVVTTAVYTEHWKAELSFFNGREPDEHRANLDFGALDSISGRVTVSPSRSLSFQISTGRLNEHELDLLTRTRSNAIKLTTSATYHIPLDGDDVWATTIAYGRNVSHEAVPEHEFNTSTHAGLLETALILGSRHTLFGRLEVVGKPAHDLHVHESPTENFTVGKLQLGYVREAAPRRGLVAGAGVTASFGIVPPALAPRYDGRVAPGIGVFLTLRPARHGM